MGPENLFGNCSHSIILHTSLKFWNHLSQVSEFRIQNKILRTTHSRARTELCSILRVRAAAGAIE